MESVDVVMPQMGESLAHGTLLKWLKQIGDPVIRGEPLFEISTDMVDAEVPSPATGSVAEILIREGQVVPVKAVVARLETANVDTALPVADAGQSGQSAGSVITSAAVPVAVSSKSMLSRQVVVPLSITALVVAATILLESTGLGESAPRGPLRTIIVFGFLSFLYLWSYGVLSDLKASTPTVAYSILFFQVCVTFVICFPRLAYGSSSGPDLNRSLIVAAVAIPVGYGIGMMEARLSRRRQERSAHSARF